MGALRLRRPADRAGTSTPRRSTGWPAAPAASSARNFLANGISCIIDDAVFPDRPVVGLGGWKRHVGPGLLPVVLLPGLDVVLARNAERSGNRRLADEEVARIHGRMAGWYGSGLPIIDNSQLDVAAAAEALDQVVARTLAGSPAALGPVRESRRHPSGRLAEVGALRPSYARHMSEVHACRRTRLRERCAAAGTAAVLVSRPANVRYLTGWAPAGAALLLAPEEDVLVHLRPLAGLPDEGRPPRDVRRLVLESAGADPAVAAADLAPELGAESLAVEEHHLTVARHRAIASVAPGMRLSDLGQAVEQLRLVKDEEEIGCLRVAAEITDQALGELLESILVGRTERHLALELERRLVDHGADGPAFATRVGAGPNSGAAQHAPTDRRVEEGDFLTVCLGARYRGYRCEMGRTFVIGTAPGAWQVELYDVVFAAQRAGREALATGGGLPRGGPGGPPGAGPRGARRGRRDVDRARGRTRNRRGPSDDPGGRG